METLGLVLFPLQLGNALNLNRSIEEYSNLNQLLYRTLLRKP